MHSCCALQHVTRKPTLLLCSLPSMQGLADTAHFSLVTHPLLPLFAHACTACPLREDDDWRRSFEEVAGPASQDILPAEERQVGC